MKSTTKNIIYSVLLISITGLFIFALLLNNTPYRSSHLFSIVVIFVLTILLTTLLFHRNLFDQLTSNLYNSIGNKNIKSESYFIGTGIFLYCFIFLLVPVFFGFEFYVKTINYQTFVYLLGALLLSLAISVPLGRAIYFGKKWLNSDTPDKIFLKMPKSTLLPAVLFSVVSAFYIGWAFPGGDMPAVIGWPIFAVGYMLGIAVLSFILATYLYLYQTSQNKLLWKWALTIIALAPYVLGALGTMS